MSSFPRYRIYDSTGTSLIYDFECVTNSDDFKDPCNFVEHQSLRGIGSIIIEGSQSAWDLPIDFVLIGTGSTDAEKYESLVSQMQSLQTTIEKFTKYIFKIELTQGGSTLDYKVKRIESFTFPLDSNTKRVNIQRVNLVLRVNSW